MLVLKLFLSTLDSQQPWQLQLKLYSMEQAGERIRNISQQIGRGHQDWHCSKKDQQYFIMETDVSLGQHKPNTVFEFLFLLCLIFLGGVPETAFIINKSD